MHLRTEGTLTHNQELFWNGDAPTAPRLTATDDDRNEYGP
jgi:hypothetical protein